MVCRHCSPSNLLGALFLLHTFCRRPPSRRFHLSLFSPVPSSVSSDSFTFSLLLAAFSRLVDHGEAPRRLAKAQYTGLAQYAAAHADNVFPSSTDVYSAGLPPSSSYANPHAKLFPSSPVRPWSTNPSRRTGKHCPAGSCWHSSSQRVPHDAHGWSLFAAIHVDEWSTWRPSFSRQKQETA